MTKREVLSTAFIIVGVICFILAIRDIPIITFLLIKYTRNIYLENIVRMIPSILTPIIYFIIAFYLFKISDRLASRLIENNAELFSLGIGQTAEQVYIVALKVVGLVFLIKSIIELIEAIFYWVMFGRNMGFTDPYPWNTLRAVMTLLLSYYLITHGDWFVNLAFKNRKVG
jgi:hypothetical protein